jgi:hypothetical protein
VDGKAWPLAIRPGDLLMLAVVIAVIEVTGKPMPGKQGIRVLLEAAGDIKVVAEAPNGGAAVATRLTSR